MMKVYLYRDNSKSVWDTTLHCWLGTLIFICEATSILEADKLFAAADIKFTMKRGNKEVEISSKIGAHALPFIGCSTN